MLAVRCWLWLILSCTDSATAGLGLMFNQHSVTMWVSVRNIMWNVWQGCSWSANYTYGQGWDRRNMPYLVNLLRLYLWDDSRLEGHHSFWRRLLSQDPPPAFWSHLLLPWWPSPPLNAALCAQERHSPAETTDMSSDISMQRWRLQLWSGRAVGS